MNISPEPVQTPPPWVVGIAAGADQRRIADAARPLVGHAAGGGGGGQVALRIQRHGTDGAELAARRAGRGGLQARAVVIQQGRTAGPGLLAPFSSSW
jgi:hypothetical protein